MFEIRRFQDADQPAVVRLHHDALSPTGAHLGAGPWDADLDAIDDVYLQAAGEFLVGTLDGEVVAMGALRRIDELVAEIKRMRTAATHQGHGFGRQMLACLERRACELGYRRLRLDTTDRQAAARHLYESFGYRETRRKPGPGNIENIIYEKTLDAEK